MTPEQRWERLEALVEEERPGGIVGQSFPKARALERLVTEAMRAAAEEERKACRQDILSGCGCDCDGLLRIKMREDKHPLYESAEKET